MAMTNFKLIVGLGNPGEDYKNTYHNIGLLFLDRLVAKNELKTYKNFEYAKTGDIVVIKPLTFMNESGEAIKSALKHFKKIKLNDILVIHDDSDIEFGKYKLSFSRGSAGHKGIESIIKTLGTKEFARLRVGVRKEAREKREKAGEFVLKKVGKNDIKLVYGLADELWKELL